LADPLDRLRDDRAAGPGCAATARRCGIVSNECFSAHTGWTDGATAVTAVWAATLARGPSYVPHGRDGRGTICPLSLPSRETIPTVPSRLKTSSCRPRGSYPCRMKKGRCERRRSFGDHLELHRREVFKGEALGMSESDLVSGPEPKVSG